MDAHTELILHAARSHVVIDALEFITPDELIEIMDEASEMTEADVDEMIEEINIFQGVDFGE